MDKLVESGADNITVKKTGVNLGARITDIDLTQPMDDATYEAVNAALVEHEVIVFPNQEISSENLIDFGRRFGELTVHPFSPNDGDRPYLIKFENNADNPPYGTDCWHSDETFRECPPMATILCSKDVPEVGGDTMFASMTSAFEGLSDRMQQFISGLEAIHDFKVFKPLFGDTEEDRKNLQEYELRYPPQVQPVVRIHPVSGKKILWVNPQFTIAIKGMDERESKSLLDTLFHQALIPEYQYRHNWDNNMIAMWDNRSVQHYAVHDYYPQHRILERVTIGGDKPFGVEAADPDSVRKFKFLAKTGSDSHGGHSAPKRQFRRELETKES